MGRRGERLGARRRRLTLARADASPCPPVVVGDARVSVVSPVCLRLEHAPGGRFVDAPSLFATNRAPYDGPLAIRRDGRRLELDTGRIRLVFEDDGRPFHAGNLRAEIRPGPAADGPPIVWTPGQEDAGNLGGPLPTLDGVLGPEPLPPGLLSRAGFHLLDDGARPLLVEGALDPRRGDPDLRRWLSWRPRPDPGAIDWYLFGYGRDYRAALRALTAIAGPVPLPRRAAFGSWYSRYWPYTSADFRAIVDEYRRHGYPLDVLVLDMDWHRAGWTGWSWNRSLLPDAEALLAWLHERGLAVTLNLHPADGVAPHEDAYPAFMRALGRDPAAGEALPFAPWDARYMAALFDEVHAPLSRAGVDFWWLDWQQVIDDLEPACAANLLTWLNRAYFALTARPAGVRRGMSFSRWGGPGDHRHPIHFSGDAHTGWPMLAFAVPFTVASGNAGLFFWSHDVGGHIGPREEEVFARWVQFGALSAALRLHATRAADMDRRPWTYAPEVERAAKRAFELRARLLPYVYASAAASCRTSVPLLRGLYFDHPEDERAYEAAQQYLLGDDLLVAPVVAAGVGPARVAEQAVFFPPGAPGEAWYHLLTGERFAAGETRLVLSTLDEVPVFARGGAPIPLQPVGPRMAGPPPAELTVRIFPGPPRAHLLYEDDGERDPAGPGASATTPITTERDGDRLVVTIGPTEGTFPALPAARAFSLELPATHPPSEVLVDGAPAPFARDEETETTLVRVPPRPLARPLRIEVTAAATDAAALRARAEARRAAALRDEGGAQAPRAALLARGIALVPVLGGPDGTGPRAALVFDEAGRLDDGGRVGFRIVDRHEGPDARTLVRLEGEGQARPGAPLRIATAGLPPLDDERGGADRAADRVRLVEIDVTIGGARHRLARPLEEARALPMRAFQIAPGGAGAPALLPSADDGLVDVAASPAAAAGPIEATTSIYSSHAQRVTFVVVADVEAALTAGGGPIGICAPDRPGALTTRVLEGSLPQGIQPLVVRLAAPGRFAVRARAARVLVELPPWQAPA